MEKDSRSIVMKFFDEAQVVGIDEAVNTILNTSENTERSTVSRLRSLAGDRECFEEGILKVFFLLRFSWREWATITARTYYRHYWELRRLMGGLQVSGYIFFKIGMAEQERPLLNEVDRFRKVAWSLLGKTDSRDVPVHGADTEEKPILPVFPKLEQKEGKEAVMAIRESIKQLVSVSDSFYIEFLKMLYRVCNYCRADLDVPEAIPELLELLYPIWEEEDFIQWILYRDLAVIVDSEKNGRTVFCHASNEITFLDGKGNSLGPMNPNEYIEIYEKYRWNFQLMPLIPSFVIDSYLLHSMMGLI